MVRSTITVFFSLYPSGYFIICIFYFIHFYIDLTVIIFLPI